MQINARALPLCCPRFSSRVYNTGSKRRRDAGSLCYHRISHHRRAAERKLLIALLSDIHANLEALDACMRHARDRGVERYAFLGDFVGYGADATGVVDAVERFAGLGAIATTST